MKTISKRIVKDGGATLPRRAIPLCAEDENGTLVVYALIDTTEPNEFLKVRIIRRGENVLSNDILRHKFLNRIEKYGETWFVFVEESS